MKLTIEKFSSVFCFGYFALPSTEEEDLCNDIREYKDLEYGHIFDSIDFFSLRYSKQLTEAVVKIFITDIKNNFASKKKFMRLILSRCMMLSETPTFFNFILVCVFVQKVISGVFVPLDLECFTVVKTASKCLIAIFYRHYVELFDKENGFEGLSSYCEKLNATFLPSDDDDSETESARNSVYQEGFTPPNTDDLISILQSLIEIDETNFLLTDFEIKLLYDRDPLPVDIDPAEDIFIQLDDNCESNEVKCLDIAMQNVNIKSNYILERLGDFCMLCKDNCYKHVVDAVRDLDIGEI